MDLNEILEKLASYDPLKRFAKKYNTPEALSGWMVNNLKYGYVDKHGNKVDGTTDDFDNYKMYKTYRLQSPQSLIKSKIGVCWDQAELTRHVLTINGIKNVVVYIERDLPPEYPTHTFVIFWKDEKPWLFENAFAGMSGLKGPFKSAEEIVKLVHSRMEKESGQKDNGYKVKFLDKPMPEFASVTKFMNIARKGMEKLAELNKDVKLYPHQQRVVDNPATSQIIAHSVGSGKTLTSIAKFERMKQEGKARRALVIVPAGLRDNFGHSNVKKFTNSKYNIVGTQQEIKKRTHTGIDPNSDYNIMSYEIFKRNPEKYLADSGADTVISDESHRGKNEDTTLTKALKRARKLYANHIGLTGSIVSNSLADVHPLVDVASGGKHTLGKNKKEFEQRYIRRSNAPQYRDLPEKRRPVIGFKNERELKRNLSANIDYADFEDIKDIANMPGKNLKIRKVPLNPEQVKAYKRILNKHPGIMKLIKMKRLETLKDEEAAKAFSGLIEARKLMNSLGSVRPGMSAAESAEATPKTRKLLDDLTQHLGSRKDAKALLFSHLITGGVDTLEAGLQQRHIPYGRFIGKGNPGSTEEIRQQDVTDYNQGKKKVMIVSSAGGEGLSLDNTTWEGILDPHYNPEKMKQMEARGIRSGGLSHLPKVERHVQVNRYLATMPSFLGIFKSRIKTPDEFIYEIASHKDAQNERLFSLLKDMQSKKRFASPKKGDIAHSVTAMPQQSDYSV